jgi:hypothetical protein
MKMRATMKSLIEIVVDGNGEIGGKLRLAGKLLRAPIRDHGELVKAIHQLPLNNKEKSQLLKLVLMDISGGEKQSKKSVVQELLKANTGMTKAAARREADRMFTLSEKRAGMLFGQIAKLGGATQVRSYTRTIQTSTRV